MDALSKQRLAQLAGKEPTEWLRIDRGYTPAERWRVTFADGSTAFAKIGSTPATAQWLRAEHAVYAHVRAPFMPRFLGFSEHPERPLLLLEDLSGAFWPPPWRVGDIERLLEALRAMAATRVARGVIPELEIDRGRFAGWLNVERDPAPFLSLGLCTEAWLSNALPTLLVAQDLAWLGGDDLVHGDLRSDNLCALPDRLVFVDWNCARRGSALFDLAFLAASLRLEGGPVPEALVPGEASLAALVCGFFAANAGLRPIPDAPQVRWIQLRQLRIALPWAARALGLPPPDGAWARRATARLDASLREGEIDDDHWFAATEEVLGDAYLASDDPPAPSGKSGDEEEFRWSRELILDALPAERRRASVLDVGAANGHLLESLVRWGEQRGLAIDPYGIDISWRLVSLAQRRWPVMADRFEVANVLDHVPSRRYDLVHTALDCVPERRHRQHVERLLAEFTSPGGRVVLRPERVQPKLPDLREQVEALGLRVGGVLERRHPASGALCRSVWLAAG
jgi:phosphotransferase family enzyme/methyltransferase family protein